MGVGGRATESGMVQSGLQGKFKHAGLTLAGHSREVGEILPGDVLTRLTKTEGR